MKADKWSLVVLATLIPSVGAAYWLGLKEYVVFGFLTGAAVRVLLLTRWRAPWRKETVPPWFLVCMWPGVLLGIYWIARKGEDSRKERIVREVLES